MEGSGVISIFSRVQHLKTTLKRWEREFKLRNGRVPSKQDIQDSPAIHSHYREYARTKLKLQKENQVGILSSKDVMPGVVIGKENANKALLGSGIGDYAQILPMSSWPENPIKSSSKQAPEISGVQVQLFPNHSRLSYPAPSSNSSASDSDGSYISATPPKRSLVRADQSTTPVSSYRRIRRPLVEISSNQLTECRKEPAPSNIVPLKGTENFQAFNLGKRKIPDQRALEELPSISAVDDRSQTVLMSDDPLPVSKQEAGFIIKRRRPGMQLEEQSLFRAQESLPAGFSASSGGCTLIRKEYQNSSKIPNLNPTLALAKNAHVDAEAVATPSLPQLSGTKDKFGDNAGSSTTCDIQAQVHAPAVWSPSKPPSVSTLTTQPLASDCCVQSMIICAEDIAPATNTEVESACTARDLEKKICEGDLEKLTVVTLKQMLFKRGLPIYGKKLALISRLRATLATGDSSSAEAEKGKTCEQKETGNVLESRNNLKRKASTVSVKEESESDTDSLEGDEKLSHDAAVSTSTRGRMLASTSPGVTARTRQTSRRCTPRSDDIHPTSAEKILKNNSDLQSADASDAAVSTFSAKETEKSFGEAKDSPIAPQYASCREVSTGCLSVSNIASPGRSEQSKSKPTALARDVDDLPASKVRRKRARLDKPAEEPSWGKPMALQRRSQGPKARGTQNKTSSLTRAYTHSVKPGERNNFVKLHLNGRGGRRKFVNKTSFRKPGAYGRRGFRGRRGRKPALEEAKDSLEQDLLHAEEVDHAGASEKKGAKFNRTKSTLKGDDAWLEVDSSTNNAVPGWLEVPSCNLPDALTELLQRVQTDPSSDNLLALLDMAFGFKSFREGQLETIERILTLQSTMVMLPTGAGKSLCYQLPAHILPGITLVISPLIALMNDQLHHLPPSLPGALMSSGQTSQESRVTVARLRAGLVKVLFISPERLCSESFQRILGDIPKISLTVIDEAHCLSEWSHNFRPSYFRLGTVLLQQMKVPCVLAMTATATKKAEFSILEALRIPSTGVVQTSRVRENLALTVSKEPNRLKSLLAMLQKGPYSEARSIIVYCTFQVEADSISDFLQQNGVQAKSYHAKKTSQERSRIFDMFCSNKLRVVVATVAFGMGLDKSDVRAVIHYNMPRSLEHYVQETGRAGRDGRPAFCHLFLDEHDYLKLRSLAHSEGVDEYAVGKVLSRVFLGRKELTEADYPVSLIIETATKEFDMKEEVLETILSYLEVAQVPYVKSVSKVNVSCAVSFHRNSPGLLAQNSIHVAAILKKSQEKQGRYVFDLQSLATHLRLSLFDLQFELRRLQAAGEITCEYYDPALCFTVLRVPEDVRLLSATLTKRLNEVEMCKVRKVDAMYMAAMAVVHSKKEGAAEESNSSLSFQQSSFQETIKKYFDGDEGSLPCQDLSSIIESSRNFLRADIKDFVRSNKHANLTGRAVARIFYGIWSPAYPHSDWSKNHLWGKYERVEFGTIKEIATVELLAQHAATRMRQNS